MTDNPFQIGDRLYASCSAEFYGEIVGIGKDENKIDTVDIKVFHPNDLIDFQAADSEENTGMRYGNKSWPDFHGLTELELPDGVLPILRKVQWKIAYRDKPQGYELDGYTDTGDAVVCLTPGNGCYRCTKLFGIRRKPM